MLCYARQIKGAQDLLLHLLMNLWGQQRRETRLQSIIQVASCAYSSLFYCALPDLMGTIGREAGTCDAPLMPCMRSLASWFSSQSGASSPSSSCRERVHIASFQASETQRLP